MDRAGSFTSFHTLYTLLAMSAKSGEYQTKKWHSDPKVSLCAHMKGFATLLLCLLKCFQAVVNFQNNIVPDFDGTIKSTLIQEVKPRLIQGKSGVC